MKLAVDTAERLGLYPLEVMLQQMAHAQAKWQDARNEIAQIERETTAAPPRNDSDGARSARLEMRREMMKFWGNAAHERAVAAAPYLHPRIASVQIEGSPEQPLQVQHTINTIVEALDAAARAKLVDGQAILAMSNDIAPSETPPIVPPTDGRPLRD